MWQRLHSYEELNTLFMTHLIARLTLEACGKVFVAFGTAYTSVIFNKKGFGLDAQLSKGLGHTYTVGIRIVLGTSFVQSAVQSAQY